MRNRRTICILFLLYVPYRESTETPEIPFIIFTIYKYKIELKRNNTRVILTMKIENYEIYEVSVMGYDTALILGD